MNYKIAIIMFGFVSGMLSVSHISALEDPFVVTLEPCWNCLDDSDGSCEQFGGKWVLIGNITFKKRIVRDSLYIQQLRLHWNGPHIELLRASLYKKNFDPTKKDFLPIDEYLICDGIWNRTKQTLIFNFEEKRTLGALEVFYLVLTVPASLEGTLKQGWFSLDMHDLPLPFQQAYRDQPLYLALDGRT